MKHWSQHVEDDVVILTIDVANQSVNVLSHEVLNELSQLLDDISQDLPKGVIIRSGKDCGFIFGADVKEFVDIDNAEAATELARTGQNVFNQIAMLKCPTVAVVHGNALGGGAELVLACDYRVAREDEGTRIGLPEVRLGIHPGFGGSVRLPRLVGDVAALDMMLTGRSIKAKSARRMGLVDVVVPERHLMSAAHGLVKHPPRRKMSLLKRLPRVPFIKTFITRATLKQVRRKANPEHYPAPFRIVDLWRHGAGLEQEAKSLGELLVGRTSRNLVHVFLIGEHLKHLGRKQKHDIKRVHVIGAGVMGGDIAAWCAHKGFNVTLNDNNPDAIARAVKRAAKFFKKKYRDPRQVEAAMDRLFPDLHGKGMHHADLVIEAIIENEEAKQKLFADVEKQVDKGTLLATNTSSIPLEVIAKSLKDPSRLIGLHFFNPVAKMQLVEIVRGEASSEQALGRARAFTVAIDRLPLDVKSSPGFLVNRILMPYLIEAMLLSEEGVSYGTIDKAAIEFGMPMGPIHLADVVGLDICLSVAQELSQPLGVPVPEGLQAIVEAGNLGKKTGRGFYRYDARGQPKRGRAAPTTVPVSERLILRLLNESIACLREGVIHDSDAVDAGMVYGTGFSPFLGGPMSYARSLGGSGISHSLYRLTEEYGKRFEPDQGWSNVELLGT